MDPVPCDVPEGPKESNRESTTGRTCSQNPVLLETVGFMTSQWHVPSLPQLPRTSATLRSLWARFQKYAGIEAGEPLHATCAAGAAGSRQLQQAASSISTGSRSTSTTTVA